MPGPAPNPTARRRNDQSGWRTLPAVCERPRPPWPFARRVSPARADLWAGLWLLPQAQLWHEIGAARIVARYIVLALAVESASPAPKMLGMMSELRQLEDKLLLSPQALVRARCVIATEVPADLEQVAGVSNLDDYRDLGVS